MRWTSLFVAVIFLMFSYGHLSDGTGFFGLYYLGAAVIALLGFMQRTLFIPSVALMVLGLGALVWMWPQVTSGDAMFYTEVGHEFMLVSLVEIWMLSLVLEHVRIHGSPFASEVIMADQEESEVEAGAENENKDSVQP